jgi:hypothetical protein
MLKKTNNIKVYKKADKYGVNNFETMVNHLWEKRKEYKEGIKKNGCPECKNKDCTHERHFDYPDYYDLPKRILNKLRGDAVDNIQHFFDEIDPNITKAEFKRKLRETLFLLA